MSNNPVQGNVIFLGKHSVGKTSLINSYLERSLVTMPTVGGESESVDIPYLGKKIKIDLVDIGGTDTYRPIIPSFFRNAQVAVFVFDQTNPDSFEEVKKWYKIADEYGIKNVFVVANKKDLQGNGLFEIAKEWCKERNIRLIKTSAKDTSNVSNLFLSIAEIVVQDPHFSNNQVNLNNENNENNSCF